MTPITLAILLAAQTATDAPAPQQAPQVEPAATGSPAETVAAFLSFNKAGRLGTPPARALVGGELTGMTARTLGPLAPADKIVTVGPHLSIARLPATRENPTDVYLTVAQSAAGVWTVDAVRAIALPPFLATMRNDLIQRVTLSDEEARTLSQINLMMQSDADLRGWFAEHRAQLDAILAIARAEPGPPGVARTIDSEATRAALGQIAASTLALSERGAVIVTLGGIGANGVGFLFADTPGALPAIDGGDYIWIEPVGNGWHLFKTT